MPSAHVWGDNHWSADQLVSPATGGPRGVSFPSARQLHHEEVLLRELQSGIEPGERRRLYPAPAVFSLVALLVIANIINIGANLGAMGEALGLIIAGPHLLYVVAFGVACAALQIYLKYTRYVSVLKWLTLVLFAYVATLFVVKIDWSALALGFIPLPASGSDYWQMTVAILGTTISPYLFFWQASQEVEENAARPVRRDAERHLLRREGDPESAAENGQ